MCTGDAKIQSWNRLLQLHYVWLACLLGVRGTQCESCLYISGLLCQCTGQWHCWWTWSLCSTCVLTYIHTYMHTCVRTCICAVQIYVIVTVFWAMSMYVHTYVVAEGLLPKNDGEFIHTVAQCEATWVMYGNNHLIQYYTEVNKINQCSENWNPTY